MVPCGTCRASVSLRVFDCEVFGTCTLAQCKTCPSYFVTHQPWDLSGSKRFDHRTLAPGLPGRRFNSAVHPWGDGYVLCWRSGWKGSDLWVCQLDRGFSPISDPVKLELIHHAAGYGREDPTLFTYRGQLHVAFVGVQGHGDRVIRTNMLYARLSDKFAVEELFALTPPSDVPPERWQKNWSFFTYGNDLYCVYSISPHRILKVEGDQVSWAHCEPFPFPWDGGELRGGASPVRVGGAYWSFVHDRIEHEGRKHQYRATLYVFSATPPFRPLALVPTPIWEADSRTNHGNYCDVVFPRGAVHLGDRWVVSAGCHDYFTELRAFDHATLEKSLVSLPAPLPNLLTEWERLDGWCGRGKMELLAQLVLSHKPERCVELGVYHGQSLLPVAAALRHNGRGHVHAVDPWAADPTQEGTNADTEHWWTKLDFEAVVESFRRNVADAKLDDWVTTVRATSQQALPLFEDESLDLIHVDGNHSPEVSTADVSGYWAKLKPGGFMVVDDSDWPSLASALEWLRGAAAQLVTDCTRFRVYRKHI